MTSDHTGRIEVDDSLFPLVVVRMRSAPDVDGWSSMFAEYDKLYTRREKFHVVTDSAGVVRVPSPTERRLISDLTVKHEPVSKLWVLGSAVVVPNALIRGALTALTWMTTPVYKLTYHSKFVECFDEAFATFEKSGVTITPAMRALRASEQK